MTSSAFPGSKILSPRAVWSSVPRHPRDRALPCWTGCVCERPGAHRPFSLLPVPLIGHPLLLSCLRQESRPLSVCCPSPAPGTPWTTSTVAPQLCIGRDEGTETFRG